jgi:LCP family protein required for cell wall assembly
MACTVSSTSRPFRALSGRLGIALLVCVALIGGVVVLVNLYIDSEVDRIPRVPLATAATENNGTNFLIVGSDSRDWVDAGADRTAFGTSSDSGPPKSDTMMVLHANGDRSFAMSFPRDTWVSVPEEGEMKLNAAFNRGPQAVVDTIQQNFELPINHYLEVDFATFEGLVNAIGGVPVYFDQLTRDTVTGLGADQILGYVWGCARLDGGQALAYVRSRQPEEFVDGKWRDVSGLADLDRIERQQEFVKTLGRVAMDRALDDPTIAPDLADAVLPNLTADAEFDRSAFNELARSLLGLRAGGVGLEFATLPTERAFRGGGQDVQLVLEGDAEPMLERLRGNVVVDPAPVPDAAAAEGGAAAAPVGPRPSDVRVDVWNGSGDTGAAGKALNALVNAGFVSGTATNDQRGIVARTEVRARGVDAAKAGLVAAYVAGADLVVDESLGGDVVVVVGENFTKIAKVEPSPDAGAATAPTPSPEAACTA